MKMGLNASLGSTANVLDLGQRVPIGKLESFESENCCSGNPGSEANCKNEDDHFDEMDLACRQFAELPHIMRPGLANRPEPRREC